MLEAIIDYYGDGEYVKTFQSKKLADCVVQHAATAGVAAMAGGILPGVGSVIATGIVTGAVWSMYIRICKIIKVDLGKNKLKALASAVLSNIAVNLAGVLAIGIAASFVPGASIVICGAGNFAVVYIAGIIFLNALTRLFHVSRKDLENMNDEELMKSVKASAKGIDMKAIFKEAKNVFMDMKRSGELDQVSGSVDINPGDDD
ncbi:MAG: hypothetical protein K2N78_04685 [Oscillospiraceae bacterium]|nr:hypothetical protein [Oscillospiraceae bacterium]